MAKFAWLLPLVLFAVGCGKTPTEKLTALSEEFVYGSLAYSPSAATAAGLHQYQKQNLDEMLDDFGEQNLDRQRTFFEKFRARLGEIPAGDLTAEDRADLTILQDQIALTLLDLTEVHSHQHAPQLYVETLGNALFAPYVLEYAPKAERIRHIVARLQKVPLYLDQAATNLMSAPDVWTQVAVEENQGNINLVGKEIRAGVPPDQAENYARAARPALEAMAKFDKFLRSRLSARNTYDWRLGDKLYPRKFRYALEGGGEADNTLQQAERDLAANTLQQAERDLTAVRAHMLELALPLHHGAFPTHGDHADLTGANRENTVIGEVLGKIADRHSTRESYMDDARKALDEARAFVQEKHFLTLPPRANLQVIPTPEFM